MNIVGETHVHVIKSLGTCFLYFEMQTVSFIFMATSKTFENAESYVTLEVSAQNKVCCSTNQTKRSHAHTHKRTSAKTRK